MEQNEDFTHADPLARLKANLFIIGIPLAALILDLLGRVLCEFDLSLIRPLESGIFIIAALSLLIAARCDRRQSLKTYRIEMWFALAFGLGALRDGLWAAGMDIKDVNVIVLALGVAGGAGVYWWNQRPSIQARLGGMAQAGQFDSATGSTQQRPPDQRSTKP